MSPLLFLAIPLVVFVVGSSVLFFAYRLREGGPRWKKAPADLRVVAPMLKEQREAGWPVGSGSYNRR